MQQWKSVLNRLSRTEKKQRKRKWNKNHWLKMKIDWYYRMKSPQEICRNCIKPFDLCFVHLTGNLCIELPKCTRMNEIPIKIVRNRTVQRLWCFNAKFSRAVNYQRILFSPLVLAHSLLRYGLDRSLIGWPVHSARCGNHHLKWSLILSFSLFHYVSINFNYDKLLSISLMCYTQ